MKNVEKGIAFLLAWENMEALASGETGTEGETATCYAYYVLGTADINVCEGQLPDDPPQKCQLLAWCRGDSAYERKCLK